MEENENESGEVQIQKPPSLRKEPSFSRWCGDDERQPIEPSTAAADESDDFDLPLLRSESDKANSESESPRSKEFRQRSMHINNSASLAHLVMNGSGKAYVPLDIENGFHTSESMEKVDSLESSSPMSSSTLSAVMVLKTLFFILVWYTFSTLLTLYNKTLLGDHLGKFPVPLMMNTVHFGMQAVLSNAIVFFQSRCCERSTGPTMTWRDYFFRVVPTALGTALDINLSNASLVFISVTFATMCKSASPIFLLVFAFAFRLESPSIKLAGIILVISVGVLLTVVKETQFEFWGFLFVMLAAVMSGFRWSMTQILLQKETYGLKNPITLMSYVTPVMTVTTAISSLMLDPWHNLSTNKYFDNSSHILQSCLLMLLGGALAFFMVLTEYFLVSATSAVTVTIAGIVKEAVTIVTYKIKTAGGLVGLYAVILNYEKGTAVAVFYFHDQFTLLKGIGLFTIMVGVSLFNWYKYQKLNKGHPSESGERNSTFNGAAKYVILDEDIPLDDDIPYRNT